MQYLGEQRKKFELLNFRSHLLEIKKQPLFLVLFFLTFLSSLSFFYYYQNGQHLLYADSISRLNISRKVIDNITPGLPQLGNVWLPLPQILMLPFIWNNFLWHSGIAGSIMSMSAYILGGIFIYKSAQLLTRSIAASIFSLCIFALNINMLYLQTTAMSESVFLCSLAAVIYFFLKWFQTNKKRYLILAALAISAMTLIRYEGLAVLFSSLPMVFGYTFFKTRKFSRAEGNVVVFATLAGLGFALWTLYLTAIFGDPLYWKTYYATPQATGGAGVAFTQAKPFLAASWQYLTSYVWMIGLIPTIFSFGGIVIMLIHSIRAKTIYFIPILMPLSIFLFMILTLQRNTPIVQPDLILANLFSGKTSEGTGFNIRYGILLLPWAAIMSSYIFRIRFFVLKFLLFLVFGIQLYSYINPIYTVIYQIPARIYQKPYFSLVNWLQKNYDHGLILISASGHEDQMFQLGFDYKTYIHEGTNKYWKESLDNPSRYATWIVLDKGHPEDQVANNLNNQGILDRDYRLVFTKDLAKIYRIKAKPYFDVSKK